MQRIGLLTSGGDCQGLNTALRAIAKTLYVENPDLELVGFKDGFEGLLNNDCRIMQQADFSGIMTMGGTILGSSNFVHQQLSANFISGDDAQIAVFKQNYELLKLSGLVILGGHGSHRMAKSLSAIGIPVLTLPVTINNDIASTDISIGFRSACQIATMVVDNIHSTATSHGRIFIIETMGHDSGWLALHAGLAGGADVIIIPEIPYDINLIAQALELRLLRRKRYSIIVIAEGAISKDEAELNQNDLHQNRQALRYQSVAWRLADELAEKINQDIRVTVPGHFQRGGTPGSCDRVLATLLGTTAAQLICQNKYGSMIGIKDDHVVLVPLDQMPDGPRLVTVNDPLVIAGRAIGLSFGDRPPV